MTKFIFDKNLNDIEKSKLKDAVYLHCKDLIYKNKEFEVEFKALIKSKSYLQLKGIHKLCEIYGDYMSEALGVKVSFENAKESLKYAIDYTRLATKDEATAEAFKYKREKEKIQEKMTIKELNSIIEGLQKNYRVPASFKDATLEEMKELIERVHELGKKRGWHNLILTNQEMQSMIEYYQQENRE
jgi:D-mannonate dehydratase